MKPASRSRAEPTAEQRIEGATCAADPDKAFREVMDMIERITERFAETGGRVDHGALAPDPASQAAGRVTRGAS